MRCPRCGEGPIFRRWWTYTEYRACPSCALVYDPRGESLAFMYLSTAFLTGVMFIVLMTVVLIGALASILLTLNLAPRASLAVAFVCFLSFIGAAQDFASYQSDGMLLEAAFISLFLVPGGLRPRLAEDRPVRRFAAFL